MTTFFNLADLGLETSQSLVVADWLVQMQAQFPGYQPQAGNMEYVQAQILASYAADLAQLCASGANSLFRTFGTDLVGVAFENGSPAFATIQITSVDTAGYTLPVSTQVTLAVSGSPLAFQTTQTLTIAPGSSTGTVGVSAVTPGVAFNGAGSPVALVDPINWITNISLVTSASGGVDPEDDDAYQVRLSGALQLLAPRPITANDFASMALNFNPAPGTDQQEVGRASAIDGYDPLPGTGVFGIGAGGTGTSNNPREVTICVTDATGQPLNTDTLTAVQAFLTSLREVNFIVNVVSPNYTTVYVATTVRAVSGFSAAGVQSAVQTALLGYLSPQNWGTPQNALSGWFNHPTVFRSGIDATIQNTTGVDSVVTGTLAFDITANPTNTSNDLLLPGPFPLPTSTTVSIPLNAIQVV